jgi:nicotinamide mononucleotide transporter
MAIGSVLLLLFAWLKWLSTDEVIGFVSGGICVWLAVRQHHWNWPIGLLNNLVFFVLFWDRRLYGDMGLQVVFFILGVYGWWNWLRRGPDQTRLKPVRTSPLEMLFVLLFIVGFTFGLRELLVQLQGAAPFWDALTTAISLGAQYLLCRKRLENWYLWIIADAIYVPLYLSRELPLTAILYGVFLLMCIVGSITWRRQMKEPAD